MQRKLGMLVVLLAIAGIGAWSYQTRPAIAPSPKTKIQTKTQTPSWVAEMDAQQQQDIAKANKLTPSQIAKIRKSSGQTEVGKMVKIRQDQLPATIVAGLDSTYTPDCDVASSAGDWSTSSGANNGVPDGWSISSGGVASLPDGLATGVYTFLYTSSESCGVDGGHVRYQYTFQVTGDLTGSVHVKSTEGNIARLALKADAATDQTVVSAVIDWGDGNTTTVNPGVQHYLADLDGDTVNHTYDVAGTYDISVTYTDDVTPTPNTVTVTTTVTVGCGDASVAGSVDNVDSTSNPGFYIWHYRLTANITAATSQTADYSFTLPDNATVYSGSASGSTTVDSGGTSVFVVIEITTASPDPASIGTTSFSYTLLTDDCTSTLSDETYTYTESTGSGTGTGTSTGSGTSSGTSTGTSSGTGTGTSSGVEGGGGSGTGTGTSTGTSSGTSSGTGSDTGTGTGTDTGTSTGTGTGTSSEPPTIPTPDVCIMGLADGSNNPIIKMAAYGADNWDSSFVSAALQIQVPASSIDPTLVWSDATDTYFDSADKDVTRYAELPAYDPDTYIRAIRYSATTGSITYYGDAIAFNYNSRCQTIPAPDGCVNSLAGDGSGTSTGSGTGTSETQIVFEGFPAANWADDGVNAILQQWDGTTWNDLETTTFDQTDAALAVSITDTTYLRFRWKLTVGDGTYYYTSSQADIVKNCCGDEVTDIIPDVPDTPTTEKNCEDGTITVSITGEGTPAFIEIARDDAPDTVIKTLYVNDGTDGGTSSGSGTGATWGESFTDDDVVDFGAYKYRARASSFGFVSDWSAYSEVVTMESDTATVTITAPTGTINGREDIIFTTTDSAADWDSCDPPDPLPACTDTPDITVTLDGIAITGAVLQSGTARNGTWKIKNWDTKDYANGSRTLKVTMKDVTCCPAMDTQTITIDNTLSNGRLYNQIGFVRTPPTGTGYKSTYLTCTARPLTSNVWRRYWVRNAIGENVTTDWHGTDADALNTAFEALQRVVLPAYHESDVGTVYGASALMSPAWQKINWVQQWIPQQTLNFYETGLDTIVKFQPNGTDSTFVFGTSTTNAKAFTYKSGTLTELVDFSDHDATDATDAAVLADKVYAVLPTELIAVDTDGGQETLNIMPRSETRTPKFVCAALGTVLAVFTDSDSTTVYDLSWASPKKLWTLDLVAFKVYGIATGFIITDGAKYYSTTATGTEPALRHTFTSNIAALDEYRVGLANGSVWGMTGASSWTQLIAGAGDAVTAISAWENGTEDLLGVAARDSDTLLEQSSTGWSDGRAIVAPATVTGDVTAITALSRHLVAVADSEDVNATLDNIQLLIGTRDNGLLGVVEMSTLTEKSGVFAASRIGDVTIQPFWDVI